MWGNAPGMPSIEFPLSGNPGKDVTVRIWDSLVVSIDQGDEAAAWFSEYLSSEVSGQFRLVRMPDEGTRSTEMGGDKVAFADGYPFLLASMETLTGLNELMAESLPMNRFRPNIVIKGGGVFFEDHLDEFKIRDIRFKGIKRCGRCPITTIDQGRGISSGTEPLATLSRFNRDGNHVYFGMNLVHTGIGHISVGDRLDFE